MSKKAAVVRLRLKGRQTVEEFAEVLNMHSSSARRYLEAAVSEGVAVFHKREAANKPDRYELSESAKRSLEPNFAYLAEVNENNKR
jgi:hypothetical protein